MLSLLGEKKEAKIKTIKYPIFYLELPCWFDDDHEDGLKFILEEKKNIPCIARAIG